MPATPTTVRALVPPHLRLPLLVVAAAALVVFTALAVHVTGASWAGRLDLGIDGLIDHRRSLRGSRAELLTWFGTPVTVVAVAAVVGVVALLRRDWALAALAALGPGLSGVAVIALKPVIGRTIGEGELSFPSGHTSGATSIGLLLAFALIRWLAPGRGVALLLVAALPLVLGAVTATGMIATYAHYPTDTVGGFCSALVMGVLVALGVDSATRKANRA
jgi:membrane-associated phospholipid phosphatase